ncbi:very long chain fatty acid elongase 4-like [Atheta coriaria]|uniref:very long chain fatty acid elongase 4-like n=1 Tax=Dalotia coriaria TaxID=877792 RepID=UPI0031F4335E
MALLVKSGFDLYSFVFTKLPDERVENWFLMSSPWPTVGLMCLYLYIILDYGPKFMKNRQAFCIDKLLVVYNAVQIICCAAIAIEGTRTGLINYNFLCEPMDYSEKSVYQARLMWFYYILKMIDLLDTIFFILRKKDNQITFLHVYHHWGMFGLSWLFAKFLPGGTILYLVVINCFVHVIMYSYYLLTAYDKTYKTSVWWKKHITQLQLAQFGILLVQHSQILLFQQGCNFPRWIFWCLIPQNLTIFSLFAEFYYKTYIKRK